MHRIVVYFFFIRLDPNTSCENDCYTRNISLTW